MRFIMITLAALATVILGGLISSTMLDFFVHPALFLLFGIKEAERVVNQSRDDVPLVDEHEAHPESVSPVKVEQQQ